MVKHRDKKETPINIPFKMFLRKTFLFAFPFLIIISLSIIIYYHNQSQAVIKHTRNLNDYSIQNLSLTLKTLFHNIKGDSRLIANHPLIPYVLGNPTGIENQKLAEQWVDFSTEKRLYDQMRLVDLGGKELLRVNLTKQGANISPRQELQNKADRYYFREAIKLNPGQIYFSPIDLNIEHNEIELPHKPMLRVCIPVKNLNGQKGGLVILNYLASIILEDIDAHSFIGDTQILFLNQEGYYLRGLNEDAEWVFMFPKVNQVKGLFKTRYPEAWRQIQMQPSGRLTIDSIILNYQWFSTKDDYANQDPYDRKFVLISMVSADRLSAKLAPYRTASWAAVILSLPIILSICRLAAGFRLKEICTMQRLKEVESQQSLILESLGEGIFGLDSQGQLTFANTMASELTGFAPHELMGAPIHKLVHTFGNTNVNHRPEHCHIINNILDGLIRFKGNDIFQRKNGDSFPVQYVSNPILKEGKTIGGVLSFFDISGQKNAEKHIEHLGLYDSLTDLPNKSLLIDRLEQRLVFSQQNQRKSALLYIDIDRFKQINDALGHNNGDNILLGIAKRLEYISQEGDTIARIGSDEFVLLRAKTFEASDEAANDAQLFSDEIMRIFEKPFLVNEEQIHLTVSIGITIFPSGNEDATNVLTQADTASSNAKNAGRNTTRFFKKEMENHVKDWHTIHNRLLYALSTNAFNLVYQPKVEHDGKIVGLEALLRWNDTILGNVSPGVFVPIAEESGLILQLSDFVLTSACQQIRKWMDAGLEKIFGHVAVNISSGHFIDKDFVKYIQDHIKKSGISPNTLELEITERTLIDDITETRNKIVLLRNSGVRFSIDDFGTGYSSLAYLQQLPIDRLKIDRAFITKVFENQDRQAIVQAIILLAKGLSMEVIAEGVELEDELKFLVYAGCTEFQGYHFYRPMSVDDVTRLFMDKI